MKNGAKRDVEKGYKIVLQGQAAVLGAMDLIEEATPSRILNATKGFLNNWTELRQTEFKGSFVQRSIKSLIEQGALRVGGRMGNSNVYVKGSKFDEVGTEVMAKLFEYVDTWYEEDEIKVAINDSEIYFRPEILEMYFNRFIKGSDYDLIR